MLSQTTEGVKVAESDRSQSEYTFVEILSPSDPTWNSGAWMTWSCLPLKKGNRPSRQGHFEPGEFSGAETVLSCWQPIQLGHGRSKPATGIWVIESSSNSWPALGLAKARSQEFHLVYHVSAEAQSLGPFSAAFPGTSAESLIGIEAVRHNPKPIWNAPVADDSLT